MTKPRIHRPGEAGDPRNPVEPATVVDASVSSLRPSVPTTVGRQPEHGRGEGASSVDLSSPLLVDEGRGGASVVEVPSPVAEGPLPDLPVALIPDGAHVWENRSGQPGSGYEDMQGPDIVYYEQVWYAVGPDGTLEPIHEGPHLDLATIDSALTESLQWEVTSGTPLFAQIWPADLGLQIDGETGHLITAEGVSFDPDALALVRAADGTSLWFDTDSSSFWSFESMGVPLSSHEVPEGPYSAVGSGPGAPSPLDVLGATDALTFDPDTLTYLRADGAVVGFHATLHDDVRTWENRSGEPDAPYADMQGPDLSYVDGVWYAHGPDGAYLPFHEGRYLDFDQVDSSIVEALQFEVLAGTPMENMPMLAELGLRLDGQDGVLVDAQGQPVDLADFDPNAPGFGFPTVDPSDEEPPESADPADDDGPSESSAESGVDGDPSWRLAETGGADPAGLDLIGARPQVDPVGGADRQVEPVAKSGADPRLQPQATAGEGPSIDDRAAFGSGARTAPFGDAAPEPTADGGRESTDPATVPAAQAASAHGVDSSSVESTDPGHLAPEPPAAFPEPADLPVVDSVQAPRSDPASELEPEPEVPFDG